MNAGCIKFYTRLCRVCLLPQGMNSVKTLISNESVKPEVSHKILSCFTSQTNVDVLVDENKNQVEYNELLCPKDSERLKSAVNLIEQLLEFEEFYFQAIRDARQDGFQNNLSSENIRNFNVCRMCLSPEPVVKLVELKENLKFPAIFGLKTHVNSEAFLMCETCLEDLKAACALFADLEQSEKIYYVVRNVEDEIEAFRRRNLKRGCDSKQDDYGSSKANEKDKTKTVQETKKSSAAIGSGFIQKREIPKARGGFKCAICDNILTEKGSLKRHLQRVHAKIKKFSCDICKKMFYDKVSLRAHIERHNSSKSRPVFDSSRPFKCSFESCNKFFESESQLNGHLKTHSDDRPFVCWCMKDFKHSKSLKTHQQNHEKNENKAAGLIES